MSHERPAPTCTASPFHSDQGTRECAWAVVLPSSFCSFPDQSAPSASLPLSDQRLCVQDLSSGGAPPGAPRPLTAADSKQRFADGDVDEARNRWVGGQCGSSYAQPAAFLGGSALPHALPHAAPAWPRRPPPSVRPPRLLCVVEDHSGDGEAVTSVGAVGEWQRG